MTRRTLKRRLQLAILAELLLSMSRCMPPANANTVVVESVEVSR